MSTRQFVACVFRPEDTRTYTFHNDGERLAVGDRAKVASGIVTVRAILDLAPTFPTKPIIGKAPVETAK